MKILRTNGREMTVVNGETVYCGEDLEIKLELEGNAEKFKDSEKRMTIYDVDEFKSTTVEFTGDTVVIPSECLPNKTGEFTLNISMFIYAEDGYYWAMPNSITLNAESHN